MTPRANRPPEHARPTGAPPSGRDRSRLTKRIVDEYPAGYLAQLARPLRFRRVAPGRHSGSGERSALRRGGAQQPA